ncbi:ComEC/Rec2 family competence protein [Verrucomicrobiaceae bacterium 227]
MRPTSCASWGPSNHLNLVEVFRQAWRYVTAVAPLVAIALACLAGAVWSWSPAAAVTCHLAAFLFCRLSWRWWLAIPIIAIAIATRAELLEKPVRESLAKPGSHFVEGTLLVGTSTGPFGDERYGWFGEEELKVVIPWAGEYQPGEVLEVKGRFFVPSAERNPGNYSRLDQWRRNRVSGGLAIREVESVGLRWQWGPFRLAERLRERLRESVTRGLPDDSKGKEVILAMMLGEKPPRDSEVSRAFRESGAMHVFAVSGLHVTLVGTLCWVVLMGLPIPRRAGVILVILSMITYAMVTGARPSAVRATVMAICFLGAFLVRRRPSLFNALALSFILVVSWAPAQVYDIGFQLSYGVLGSIGLGVGLAYRFTGKIAELDPLFPARLMSDWGRRWMTVRRYFASLAASSMAAWLGSLPLMMWHFGIVTPIAVLTSLVLIPLTMVILGGAFLGAFLGMFSSKVGEWANQANAGVATAAYYSAAGFSDIPGGHWNSRRLIAADWVAFDTADGGSASFLDVEGGAMIDVGGRRFFYRELRSILGKWNANVETVVVSHPDGEHCGALPYLLNRGGIKRAILPVEKALSPSYREFLAGAEGAACEVEFGKTGAGYVLDEEVWVEVIREGPPADRGVADNRIMVVRVHWQGWKILVTSDLGMVDELALLERGVDLEADVVLMGRHEWGASGQKHFLDATGAKVVITSSGQYLPREMPKPDWMKRLRAAGYVLFNQAETGAVLMDFSEDSLVVKSFLEPRVFIELHK